MFKRRDAISNVTSTIILSSVLLSIMMTATYLANDILNIQIAASEFETAEDLAITIDSEIHKLLFKPGSSAIIKASFSTTAPGYTKTGEIMDIVIEDSNTRMNLSAELSYFNLDGRQAITGAPDYYPRGDSSNVLNSTHEAPHGCIHVHKPGNIRASLDYNRVLYTFTGIIKFVDEFYNTLEVTYLNLTFGKFELESTSIILIQNKGVETETLIFDPDWSMTVTPPDGISRRIDLDDIGGDIQYKTQVNFHVVHIQISVMGGG